MTSTETRDDGRRPADAEAEPADAEGDADDEGGDEPRATCEGGLARF